MLVHPAVDRFRALLRIATVSRLDSAAVDWSQFVEFRATLARLYPRTHAHLELELVDDHALLYRWRGSGTGPPAVLMAHVDVVPATDEGWDHPPFAAELVGDGAEQEVWGRGTLDDKSALTAIFEAVESSVAEGYVPANDVYLSFGHNEETTGDGARAIVELLESRGIRPAIVLDEGGAIVEGVFPGVSGEIAVIGVSEKGVTTLTLTVEQAGGHASTPQKTTATVLLARAISRLAAKPFPAGFSQTNLEMIRTLGKHARQPFRFVFGNLWLTRRLLLTLFARLGDETNALVRTTQAVTMLSASEAANVLAERAVATVNIRVAVGSSVAAAVAHVRAAIDDDAVRIEVTEPNEPSPVSPSTGDAWDRICDSIDAVFPGTIVTPYIQLGASDSRRFTRISDHVYRFSPFRMSKAERDTLHARNERIRVETFLRGIDFYRELLGRL